MLSAFVRVWVSDALTACPQKVNLVYSLQAGLPDAGGDSDAWMDDWLLAVAVSQLQVSCMSTQSWKSANHVNPDSDNFALTSPLKHKGTAFLFLRKTLSGSCRLGLTRQDGSPDGTSNTSYIHRTLTSCVRASLQHCRWSIRLTASVWLSPAMRQDVRARRRATASRITT